MAWTNAKLILIVQGALGLGEGISDGTGARTAAASTGEMLASPTANPERVDAAVW